MSSARTSQETRHASTTKPSQLILFGEIFAVYCENHKEPTRTLCGQNAEFWYVTAGGTYSDHRALKGYKHLCCYAVPMVGARFNTAGPPRGNFQNSHPRSQRV
jgi:hypothetical protein